MTTYKIKCPKCKEEFTKECIILLEKRKKVVEGEKLKTLAPEVQDLIAQISKKTINIKKITIVSADREQQLQQNDNLGTSLEVIVVPSPGPGPK